MAARRGSLFSSPWYNRHLHNSGNICRWGCWWLEKAAKDYGQAQAIAMSQQGIRDCLLYACLAISPYA